MEEALDRDSHLDSDKKVFCANCEHCKLVKVPLGNGSQYVLRVRCSKGQWKKKSGEEKLHKYFTLARRVMDGCPHYSPMGSAREFIRELKAALPTRDEIYS